MGILLDMITEVLLKETLLCTPVMGTFWIVTGMVTLGADDFLDFLLGFLVDFFLMLLERTYIDPYLGYVIDFVIEKVGEGMDKLRKTFKLKGKTAAELKAEADAAEEEAKNRDAGVDFSSGDTVEPILGAYSGYSGDAMGLPYALFPMIIMADFDDCIKMRTLYGIKAVDLGYYILFSAILNSISIRNRCFLFASTRIDTWLENLRLFGVYEISFFCNGKPDGKVWKIRWTNALKKACVHWIKCAFLPNIM